MQVWVQRPVLDIHDGWAAGLFKAFQDFSIIFYSITTQAHHLQFFYGVDWESIRDIDAPFVPHLRSITDTSYFPTDELDQVPEVPSGADSGPDAKKDLAFLGYTFRRYEML